MSIESLHMVVALTSSVEVSSSLDVSNINLVFEVLKLREVQGGSSLSIEGLNMVVSSTSSVEVGNGLDISDIDFVDEVLEGEVQS